jgi:hypothetical protein
LINFFQTDDKKTQNLICSNLSCLYKLVKFISKPNLSLYIPKFDFLNCLDSSTAPQLLLKLQELIFRNYFLRILGNYHRTNRFNPKVLFKIEKQQFSKLTSFLKSSSNELSNLITKHYLSYSHFTIALYYVVIFLGEHSTKHSLLLLKNEWIKILNQISIHYIKDFHILSDCALMDQDFRFSILLMLSQSIPHIGNIMQIFSRDFIIFIRFLFLNIFPSNKLLEPEWIFILFNSTLYANNSEFIDDTGSFLVAICRFAIKCKSNHDERLEENWRKQISQFILLILPLCSENTDPNLIFYYLKSIRCLIPTLHYYNFDGSIDAFLNTIIQLLKNKNRKISIQSFKSLRTACSWHTKFLKNLCDNQKNLDKLAEAICDPGIEHQIEFLKLGLAFCSESKTISKSSSSKFKVDSDFSMIIDILKSIGFNLKEYLPLLREKIPPKQRYLLVQLENLRSSIPKSYFLLEKINQSK